MKKLLIIEDNETTSIDLSKHYQSKGWSTEVCPTVATAKELLKTAQWQPHVIIADLGLPDGSILDHLEDLSEQTLFTEWIFTFEEGENTDTDRIDDLAYDFLIKPFDQKRLDIIVNRALRSVLTQKQLHYYSSHDNEKYTIKSYLGKSEAVKSLRDMLQQLSQAPLSSMIITGETGTGKGLVARILHHTGLRKNGPMVEINCAALPKELLESQLFGHEAGAFTGAKHRHRGLIEQAHTGTLFLDEIGEMDIELQAKLLKAIEDQKIRRLGSEKEMGVDVQFIAATSIDLEQASKDNDFRDDLFHRLSVFQITLPPLRERKNDLIEIIPPILAEFNEKADKQVKHIPDPAWEKLLAYNWPGNVRELRNVIERCVLLAKDENLPMQWLQLGQSNSEANENHQSKQHILSSDKNENKLYIPLDGSMSLDDMDSHIIQTALEQSDYNVSEAARALKTTREKLRYRIRKYHLITEPEIAEPEN